MDFDEVARATRAAIARERGGGGQSSSKREQDLGVILEKHSGASGASHKSIPASTRRPASSAVEGYDEVAQESFSATSQQQQQARLNAPLHSFGRKGSHGRYSLQDMLKDCLTDGQWARAFQFFTTAVEQACRQVLVSGGTTKGVAADGGVGALATSSDSSGVPVSSRESECFSTLRKMLAALPPTRAGERTMHVKNIHGIMRWTGWHYYLLWKCLLEAGRVEEVQRVWSVMQQTGFVEYQLEERTVNSMMALLRRTSSSTEVMVAAIVPPGDSVGESRTHLKGIRRELVKGLEQAAAARGFKLDGANRRTAEGIRIVEALERTEEGRESQKALANGDGVHGDSANLVFSARTDEVAVAVGDFNGLLRRARSVEATDRVLRMMTKLNIEKKPDTYASLIAALHNPQYVLLGHTAEELATHQAGGSASGKPPEGEVGRGPTKVGPAFGDGSTLEDHSLAKKSYEAYKQKRIEAGLAWFAACPSTHRTADVFNELLYLLRAKAHWSQFDRLLVQFRGNAVVTQTTWPEALTDAESPVSNAGAAASESSSVPGPILPPNWSAWPNGKTYELLIHRARYVHQWEVMWALYKEMIATGVNGTPRLYEVLLLEARSHPPKWVLATRDSGNLDASSSFLFRLYEELRSNGGDVHSLKGTLSVVNAWTRSRARLNRWDS
ncbi:hypothetical protein JKF63_02475 [Porcisia hertigi]|uniref:Uncharacterized protein n=1 Tax=Porcisia hertigi TaxID=2761500 RepID=A0A836L2T8_9TRYP|nr:hypothetical protein JKF63_02475 [Porcisia hertigi]